MKAIVIAAGLGSRLGGLTKEQPKCLLDVGGKTILEHQVAAFSKNQVSEIFLIKGHCKEALDGLPFPSFINEDFRNNNILASLMKAQEAFDGGFIASYSDILYSPDVVQKLQASTADISVVIDQDWKEKYEGRTEHPLSEAELASTLSDLSVTRLGKNLEFSEGQDIGEFIGLFKFSAQGAELLKEYYSKAEKSYEGRPFFAAREFKKAYITDMMMYFIEQGIAIQGVPIQRQWMEIDTEQDLERARIWITEEGWA